MKLKIVHLSTSDLNGGAAIAALRIHSAQLKSGINSKLIVQSKFSDDSNVISLVNSSTDKLKYRFRLYAEKLFTKTFSITKWDSFTLSYFGLNISELDLITDADIINIHQINEGFLSLNSLSSLSELNKPIIFTLHDMWSFTGGCHYNNDCKNFIHSCGNCPSLKQNKENDFSRKIYSRKNIVYSKMNLNIIACSNWMNEEAKKSSLLCKKKIRTINNPVDTELFKPNDKTKSCAELDLPDDKSLLLVGAMNLSIERKGFNYLIAALNIISKSKSELIKKLEIIIFGSLNDSILSNIPFKVYQLGKINNERKLVSCYNAADVYITPSLQDNLPNTCVESLSCGTPVVAFNTGGMPDMIEHLKNGYLAERRSSEDLAAGIVTLLSDSELLLKMKEKCRETALGKFNEVTISNQYLAYYNELLAKKTNAPNS